MASIQKRTSPVKFAHLAEESSNGSVSNLSTKVDGSGFLDEREITAFVRIVRRLGGMVPDEEALWSLKGDNPLKVQVHGRDIPNDETLAKVPSFYPGLHSNSPYAKVRRYLQYSTLSADGLVKQMMEDCDANHDGKISRAEFTELGRRLQLKKCLTKLAI